MKRFALFVTVIFAMLLGLLLAWRLSSLVLAFVASLAVAATLRAPIEWLMVRRVPRGLAILLVYGMFGALAVLLLVVLYERLGSELAPLSEDLGLIYARLRERFTILQQIGPGIYGQFPTPEQMTQLLTDGQISNVEHALAGMAQGLAGSLGQFVLVLVLSIYWTVDNLRFERAALSLLPAYRRGAARELWRAVESGLGRYLRSELLQSLLAGLLLTPAFMLLDLRWPVFWALAVSLTWLIPLVGALIVIVPMAIIVEVQSGPVTAVLAVAITLAVLALLEFGVERRLYQSGRGASVLMIMVALVMADAFGFVGLLLAPPVSAVFYILLTELADQSVAPAARPLLDANVTDLTARLASARDLIASQSNGANRRLESIADRLEDLLDEARRVSG